MKVKSLANILAVLVISVNVFPQFVSSKYRFENHTNLGTPPPVLFPFQEITSDDGTADDEFGYSSSLDGDFAVVGAYLDDGTAINQGSAYLFMRSGFNWIQLQRLFAPDAAANDQFGFSVDLDSATQTIVVGAKSDDNNTFVNNGAAYVFTNTGDNRKLIASDTDDDDQFGRSVAIDTDTIIVSSSDDDDNGLGSGSAYIFLRRGADWIQQAKLLPDDGAANDQFGWSADISGDTAVVGARFESEAGFETGAAYVFVRSGTTWTQQAKLMPADGVSDEEFGWSVAIFGDSIIVGARAGRDDSNIVTGAAYVFVRSGTTWTQQAKLNSSDGVVQDEFGNSVDIQANSAVVGTHLDDDVGSGSGSVYAFQRSGTIWTEQRKLVTPSGTNGDNLGESVSISGTTVLAGAPGRDIPASPGLKESFAGANQGAGFFFNLLAPTAASATISGRVLTENGIGISNAHVQLTDQSGNILTAQTNQFGYYRFDEIEVGQTMIGNVFHKQYQFDSQIISLDEDIVGLNFVAR